MVRAFAFPQRARLGLPLCGVGSCFAFPQRRLRGLPSVALVRAFAFPQRARLGLPPPRPMGLARELSPMRPLIGVAPSGAGRGLWCVRLAADVCFASCADNSARTGATRAARPPKTERGNSESNKFAPNLPRSVFRLAAGVAPYPMRRGQHRARSTGDTGAQFRLARPTLRFGYSRAKFGSTGTLRGLPKRARESFPASEGLSGHNHGR